jgi:glycosyltransferase involved in cell wall biosynthesis
MLIRNNTTAYSPKLVLTGAPDARQQWLQHASNQMGLTEHIVFPGYLPSEQLHQIMQHASGVIFPSLYEGFGLPLIEAMAAGVPVACSNCTAMPEIAGDAAILFNPTTPHNIYQALQTLLFDEKQRATLIQRGLKRALEFSDTTHSAIKYWDAFVLAKEGTNSR